MSEKEDIQEQLERERFKGVYLKIDANYELVNNKIDTNHKEVKEEISANHKETKLILKQILAQTTKTNGRVNCLEDETRFFRTITKYPKLAGLALVGLIVVGIAGGVIGIVKIF